MELKCNAEAKEEPGEQGSNRTFMELKYGYSLLFSVYRSVLIAPLWN